MVFMQRIKTASISYWSGKQRWFSVLASLLFSPLVFADKQLNLQEPVTDIARDIYGLHMLIFWVCVAIFVVVFGVMFASIFLHRKSKNPTPSTFSHNTKAEVIWTIIPFVILVAMAVPASQVLIKMEDTTKSDLTIKITGYQWKWEYEYLGTDIRFYSTLSTPRNQIDQFNKETAQPQGENYLLEVDNRLVVPSGKKIRALITANDVIHAWWIPQFGVKKDAIPGYINELWFNVDEGKEGIYRGQCAELCGKDHAFMPIVVEVVTQAEFDQWLSDRGVQTNREEGKDNTKPSENVATGSEEIKTTKTKSVEQKQTEIPEKETGKKAEIVPAKWGLATAMAKGEPLVAARCAACHGVQGKGIPGVFPAIAGGSVATGDINQHIEVVMFGRSGTAMAAFANQLSDEELAAVITYQRNAYGNDSGDLISPEDIKAKRQ